MKTRLVTVAAAFALIYGLPAMAQSRTQMLKGDFAFTTSAACVVSPASFFPTYQPPAGFSPALVPLGPSFVFTNSFQGVRTFNGDGTGSVTARVVTVPISGAASANDVSGQFTYSVAADRTLTIDDGPFHSVPVAGPGVGQQQMVSNFPTYIGRLSSDGRSLTFATFNPGVEVVTMLVPAPELVASARICHRASNGVRISRTPGAGEMDED
jgi:hypothetical protein